MVMAVTNIADKKLVLHAVLLLANVQKYVEMVLLIQMHVMMEIMTMEMAVHLLALLNLDICVLSKTI